MNVADINNVATLRAFVATNPNRAAMAHLIDSTCEMRGGVIAYRLFINPAKSQEPLYNISQLVKNSDASVGAKPEIDFKNGTPKFSVLIPVTEGTKPLHDLIGQIITLRKVFSKSFATLSEEKKKGRCIGLAALVDFSADERESEVLQYAFARFGIDANFTEQSHNENTRTRLINFQSPDSSQKLFEILQVCESIAAQKQMGGR